MSATTPQTRPLADAITWTNNWQQNNKSHAKAFLIPMGDILACLNELGAKFTIDSSGKIQASTGDFDLNIRAYMGTDDSSPAEDHLLLVGTTTTDGKKYKDIVETPGGESLVYDFTKPCPNNCDEHSKLYHKIAIEYSK
ncbi:hypothetical protein [Psychroserpens damuponensis]|uniref:hypothetical protein n=1 Tax=Psychroserpens damuponensis TaxID=943936 RepID=UPI00058D3D45|nr:hypothetical protein [Psychroserpens damuponensis]